MRPRHHRGKLHPPRRKAGALIALIALIATTGTGTGTGDTLTSFALEHLPFMRPGYSTMATPALVFTGCKDQSSMSTRGPDWLTDACTLGGVAGEAVRETSDEDPARAALVADAVAADILDALGDDTTAWDDLQQAAASSGAFSIDSK